MGLISWIIFGAIAGWISSKIAGTDDQMGCLLNIIAGVVGAAVGGVLVELLSGDEFSFGFNLTSFIVAIVGAVILLLIVQMVFGRRRQYR